MAVAKSVSGVRDLATSAGIDLTRLPRHIGVIMDGNGRWAEAQGQPRLVGHAEGYRTLKRVLKSADQLGIEVLTVYGFSAENWRRPADEVEGLMALIAQAARTELSGLVEENVRVRVPGRLHELPEETRAALKELVDNTRDNTGIVFCIAVNYGGRAEIVDAVRQIVRDGVAADAVTEDDVSARLYCADLPEPDLIVRTAGELRWSNFLIWQAAYAELFVTQKTWPEFDDGDLVAAVAAYQKRFRKFGGLGGSATTS